MHDECPAKGQLLAERKKSPIADIRNYFHGTVVDLAMRRWLSQDRPEKGQMLAWVNDIFAQAERDARESGDGVVTWKYAGDKAETLEFCRECVARLEVLLEKICLPYHWDPAVRFEERISIPGLDDKPRSIILAGEIDLLVDYPAGIISPGDGGVVPWDLKATRDDQYWRKVKGQLVFYAIIVAIRTGKWPLAAGLLQPMCTEQAPTFAFTQEDYVQMFSRIKTVAHDVWSGNILPKASNAGCQYCEARRACPKFRSARGRAPLPAVSRP